MRAERAHARALRLAAWARVAIAGGLVCVLAALALLGWGLWPDSRLEIVEADSGRALASLALREEDPFLSLSYVHSVYRQPVREEFRIRDQAFELVSIRSPSEAVLDYYARREPVLAEAAGYVVYPAAERFPQLDLLASSTGRRSLDYAGQRIALYELAGDGARLTLRAARAPRPAALWSRTTAATP